MRRGWPPRRRSRQQWRWEWTPERDRWRGEGWRDAAMRSPPPYESHERKEAARFREHRGNPMSNRADFPGGSSSSGRERRPRRPPDRIFGCEPRELREALERHAGDGQGEGGSREAGSDRGGCSSERSLTSKTPWRSVRTPCGALSGSSLRRWIDPRCFGSEVKGEGIADQPLTTRAPDRLSGHWLRGETGFGRLTRGVTTRGPRPPR
jgi:hypothetical protein